MKLNILTVIIANPSYPLTYANYPSKAYTVDEHEKLHGYGSICRSDVNLKRYHIIADPVPNNIASQFIGLIQHLKKNSYTSIHFYFETPSCILLNLEEWTTLFSYALDTTISSNGFPPYLFTHSNANVPLNDVLKGILNNTPSDGYSDFLDHLYLSLEV